MDTLSTHIQRFSLTSIVLVILLSVLSMSILGVMGMSGKDHEMMPACPFMSSATAICPMTVSEHIAQWESFLRAIVPWSDSLLRALVFSIVLSIFFIDRLLWHDPPHPTILSIYSRYRSVIRVIDRILIAFSRGILQPKLFA